MWVRPLCTHVDVGGVDVAGVGAVRGELYKEGIRWGRGRGGGRGGGGAREREGQREGEGQGRGREGRGRGRGRAEGGVMGSLVHQFSLSLVISPCQQTTCLH